VKAKFALSHRGALARSGWGSRSAVTTAEFFSRRRPLRGSNRPRSRL